MIEEIQALMPILERISDGALWAFAIFMSVKALSILVWPLILLVIAVKAVPKVVGLIAAPNISDLEIYRVQHKGKDTGTKYIGDFKTIDDFLSWASGGRSYVYESDLKKIQEGKRNES